jgi:pimeloyl-ACP methyl ester carboxylesterase
LCASALLDTATAQTGVAACAPCGKPPARHIVIADGHQLTVWAKRPASARGAILLVHGRRWSSLPNFDLQVPGERRSVMDALAASGIATYALDMRGYGATPRDSTGWITPDRAAADVAAVLDWITRQAGSSGPPALLGYSRGSTVALLTAQRYPGRLSALILYAFPVDIDAKRAADPDPALPSRARNTRDGAAEDFITPGAASAALREAFVKAAITADPVTVDWAKMHQLNAMDAATVRVPTLLIAGSRDPLAAGTSHSRLFARLGADDRAWVVLPEADHAAHIERSYGAFIHAITSFLGRPRGPAVAP